jgi:hypothetical protein
VHFTPVTIVERLTRGGIPGFRDGCDAVVYVSTQKAIEHCTISLSPANAALTPDRVPVQAILCAITVPGKIVIATGPALKDASKREREICGIPEPSSHDRSLTEEMEEEDDLGEESPTARPSSSSEKKKAYIEKEKGHAEEDKGKRRKQDKLDEKSSTLTLKPNPASYPKLEPAKVCQSCGLNLSPSALVCLTCFQAVEDKVWKEEIEETLAQLMASLNIARRWTDRGPRSSEGDRRKRFKRYVKRAWSLGFTGAQNRWHNDPRWRACMMQNGWDDTTIHMIDDAMLGEKSPTKSAGQRTAVQRTKSERYYHAHRGDALTAQFPAGTLERPLDVQVSNARRREETARWRQHAEAQGSGASSSSGAWQDRSSSWWSSSSSWWTSQGSWWNR